MEKLSLPKRQPNKPQLPIEQIRVPKNIKWYENDDFVLGLGIGACLTILSLLVFLLFYGLIGALTSIS